MGKVTIERDCLGHATQGLEERSNRLEHHRRFDEVPIGLRLLLESQVVPNLLVDCGVEELNPYGESVRILSRRICNFLVRARQRAKINVYLVSSFPQEPYKPAVHEPFGAGSEPI